MWKIDDARIPTYRLFNWQAWVEPPKESNIDYFEFLGPTGSIQPDREQPS
jgi:hypothetical protein